MAVLVSPWYVSTPASSVLKPAVSVASSRIKLPSSSAVVVSIESSVQSLQCDISSVTHLDCHNLEAGGATERKESFLASIASSSEPESHPNDRRIKGHRKLGLFSGQRLHPPRSRAFMILNHDNVFTAASLEVPYCLSSTLIQLPSEYDCVDYLTCDRRFRCNSARLR